MAIDITKGSHVVSFPSKVASMMGQYSHVYNIVLDADTDNGALAGRGDYVSFDQYEVAALPTGLVGTVLEYHAPSQMWLVEISAVPATGEALYLYNSPVSPYPERELQDESLFYNASGDVVQGAVLVVGDVIALSANAFTGTVAGGKTVKYVNGKYVIQ